MFVPTVHTYASAAANELGQKLTQTIQSYQQTHPGLSRLEIRGALRIAETNTCPSPIKRILLIFAVMIALALAIVTFGMQKEAKGPQDVVMVVPVLVAVLIAGLLVVFMLSRRQ